MKLIILKIRNYNAGKRPITQVLDYHPEWIHRVKHTFAVNAQDSLQLYVNSKFEWRKWDVIHLLINHRNYCK